MRTSLKPLLFLMCIFLCNFLARIVFAPLMPVIETKFNISHSEAGFLFMIISAGYCIAMIASGFVSSKISHKKTIVLSAFLTGVALISITMLHSLWEMRLGLFFLGVSTGLYLPSGMATITDIVAPQHWGKAIAIHELAPVLATILAPFLTEAFLIYWKWHMILVFIGGTSLFLGCFFSFFCNGGDFPGSGPSLLNMKSIVFLPAFWIITILFSLALGMGIGLYNILPLYLINEREFERSLANTLIGFSRFSVIFTTLIAGWLSDRIGAKKTIRFVLLLNGLISILLASVPGNWVLPVIFIQPVVSVFFFPAAFTILSYIGPSPLRNITVSLTVFIAYFVGAGLIPAAMGIMGEAGSFALSIILVGIMNLLSVILIRFLFISSTEQIKVKI